MLKKIIRTAMVMMLVISAIPINVMAEEGNSDIIDESEPSVYNNSNDIDSNEKDESYLNDNGFSYYIKDDGTAEIVDFENEEKIIEIPEKLGDVTVTSLGVEALAHDDYVEDIVVPSTVNALGNSAFYSCHNLKTITFKGQIPQLGFTLVEGCRSLESIYIYIYIYMITQMFHFLNRFC